MTTTYELYTNENGTPKAVEGKAPAIIERVEALDTALAGKAPMSHTHTVSQITDMPKVVFSVNDVTPDDNGNVNLGLHAVATSGNYNDLSNKPTIPATPKAYVTETWTGHNGWYRKYSDGWIEQGGLVSGVLGKENFVVNYPTPFGAVPTFQFTQPTLGAECGFVYRLATRTPTTTTLTNFSGYSTHGENQMGYIDWYACGY